MISFILSFCTTEMLPVPPPIHTKSHTLDLLVFSVDNSVLAEMLEMSLRERPLSSEFILSPVVPSSLFC